MRLVRLGSAGHERPHLLDAEGQAIDVSDTVHDFDPEFFAGGGIERLRDEGYDRRASAPVESEVRLGAPVTRPGKIVCIGLNYHDHARETGATIPQEPVVFMKATNTLSGPYDDVRIPRGSTKTDWEVELGVVIGRTCRYLPSADEGLASVAGFMVCNDLSERAFQLERGGQWDKGKSCETFNPAGPWLVTPDEVPDLSRLSMWLDVNGRRRQDGSTAAMAFGVGEIVAYLSQFMVLDAGDIINTGTPAGVAMGLPDQPYLRPGDVVELGISQLGAQRQRFVSAP